MKALARRMNERSARAARRAQHNDFDYACVYWWGDRHPAVDDRTNREFGGDPTGMDLRRCLVCRPYTDEEDLNLIGYTSTPVPNGTAR